MPLEPVMAITAPKFVISVIRRPTNLSPMAEITGKVTTIMHDTNDLEGAVSFWTQLLDLSVVHKEGTYAYLSPLSEGGPHLAFQLVPEPRATKMLH